MAVFNLATRKSSTRLRLIISGVEGYPTKSLAREKLLLLVAYLVLS